jgi:hemolysin III
MVTSADKIRVRDREDIASGVSHFAGALLSVAALIVMVVFSAIRGNAWHIISSFVFGFSMIFLYMSSAIAHWLPAGKKKDTFFILDQAAIFILIAGTYTPLTLISLRGVTGWILFGIEWGLAILGIFRLLRKTGGIEDGIGILDILIYVVMGWLVVIFAGAVLRTVPIMAFIWIIIGGLFYTFGIIFFRFTRFRYHHLVWHLMVIGGTASHFTAIFFYILP